MRLTKEQAAENRRRILTAAARLFREHGLESVGVADVMKEAGFTHGGFYNHFASKEALAAEACRVEMQRSGSERDAAFEAEGSDAFEAFVTAYASRKHRDHPGSGCVVAALAGDASRQDKRVQSSFAESVEGMASAIAKVTGMSNDEALRSFSELVGSVLLSRAVSKASPALADEIIAATRNALTTAEPSSKRRRAKAR